MSLEINPKMRDCWEKWQQIAILESFTAQLVADGLRCSVQRKAVELFLREKLEKLGYKENVSVLIDTDAHSSGALAVDINGKVWLSIFDLWDGKKHRSCELKITVDEFFNPDSILPRIIELVPLPEEEIP